MSGIISGAVHGKPEPVQEAPMSTSLAYRTGLFMLFLVCALAIFVLGSNYYQAFPTNGNRSYSAILSAVFLIAAFLLKRNENLAKYWQLAYAFFVASTVNLVSALFAGSNSTIVGSLGLAMDTNEGLAIAKVYDALLVVIPIIVLVKFTGAELGSLFLKRGNLKWGLGIGALVLFNFSTSALIFFGTGYSPAKLGSAMLWGAVFAFSNGFLEELWLRGLFLKKLVPMVGVTGGCSDTRGGGSVLVHRRPGYPLTQGVPFNLSVP